MPARSGALESRLVPFVIAGLVFALDRLTKLLIQARFSTWDLITVIPGFFNIVHAENPGIAFGILSESRNPWRNLVLIGASGVIMLLIGSMLVRPGASPSWTLRTGLAFVFGGALGNLYDRVVHGTVTDFVEVYMGTHYFPAFNVADSAITIGAGLLLLDMWRSRERHMHAQTETGGNN